jgi:ABC-type branched-subunit amino acid transport system substrate-binding protein
MNGRFYRPSGWIGAAAVTVGATLVLSACSSGGGSGSGASGPSALKIMVIGTFNSTAMSYPEVAAGAQAAADEINAAGGVGGHKISIVQCNDQNDPNVAASCGEQAVTDQVVAVTSGVTNYSAQFLPVLQQAGIADIGDTIYQAVDLTSPVAFPFDGGSFSQFAGVGVSLANAGCKKVGVVRLDVPVTESQAKLVFLGAQTKGAAAAPDLAVAPNLASFAATVQSEINGGADCLASILPNAQVDALISAVKQSAKPAIKIGTAISTLPTTDLAKLGSMPDGDIAVSTAYPVTAQQAAPFLADMKKYEPSGTVSAFAVNSWAAVKAFAAVEKGKQNITAKSVLSDFDNATSVSVPMYPAAFDFAKPNPVKSLARITNPVVLAFTINGTAYQPAAPPTVNTSSILNAYAG